MTRTCLVAGPLCCVAALGCPADDPIQVDPTTTGIPAGSADDGAQLTTSASAADSGTDSTTGSDADTGIDVPADSSSGASSESTAADSSDGAPPATCGNNVREGDEVCDLTDLDGQTCASLGHDGGVLACLLDCSQFNVNGCYVCGNGVLDQGEECEGVVPDDVDCDSLGYGGGTVACGGDCFYDVSDCSVCGDGVVQGIESCDMADLGGQTCASLGLEGGTLGCSAGCTYDYSGCDIAGTPFGSDGFYSGFALQPGVLPCDEISATGTPTALGDDANVVVPMGFSFPVYGTAYDDVNIQSNGTLRWGDGTLLSYGNTCLPTATTPNTNTLYVFWDDLNPTLGVGEIWYQTLGPVGDQRFVVQWDTANYSGDPNDLMRFQVVLHEATGQIDVCYVDTINTVNTGNSGAEATAGIQQDGTTALGFSCDMPNLTDGTMLFYIPS